MTTKFSKSTSPTAKAKAPDATGDDKRSFDARPKPSNDHRRDARERPSQHVDRVERGLDPDPGLVADEQD